MTCFRMLSRTPSACRSDVSLSDTLGNNSELSEELGRLVDTSPLPEVTYPSAVTRGTAKSAKTLAAPVLQEGILAMHASYALCLCSNKYILD